MSLTRWEPNASGVTMDRPDCSRDPEQAAVAWREALRQDSRERPTDRMAAVAESERFRVAATGRQVLPPTAKPAVPDRARRHISPAPVPGSAPRGGSQTGR